MTERERGQMHPGTCTSSNTNALRRLAYLHVCPACLASVLARALVLCVLHPCTPCLEMEAER
eukprot:11679808-Alexandrium_andersonii.AAC.1